MPSQNFQLSAGQTYIQLNNLLKLLQIAQTGGHAKLIIQNKEVMVNGSIDTRVRKKLVKGDVVTFEHHKITITQ